MKSLRFPISRPRQMMVNDQSSAWLFYLPTDVLWSVFSLWPSWLGVQMKLGLKTNCCIVSVLLFSVSSCIMRSFISNSNPILESLSFCWSSAVHRILQVVVINITLKQAQRKHGLFIQYFYCALWAVLVNYIAIERVPSFSS